jgi:parallel beta-helix repeat protein
MKPIKCFIRFIGAHCLTIVCLTISVWLLYPPKSFAVEVIKNQGASMAPSPEALSNTPDIIVNTTSDVIDFSGNQQVADLPGIDGLVSLREAIKAANATPGPQVIGFNIPIDDPGFGENVFTIKVKTNFPLDPLMDNGTTIDGSTQTSFTGDSNPDGPEIVINGEVDAGGGLEINSAYNVISDLVINGFLKSPHGVGIKSAGAHNNLVTRCYIGLNATGEAAVPNDGEGVSLESAAENNIIINNVISGNIGDGIAFYEFLGLSTQNNVIQGNYIGTDPTGTIIIGNGRFGIGINLNEFSGFIDRNIIGGAEIGDGNIIMGNKCGISITTKDVDGNIIKGNIISKNQGAGIVLGGVNVKNQTIIGGLTLGSENMITENGGAGIEISSNGNQILGNIISHNQGQGIHIEGWENRISRNSIFSNGELGIDLGGDWVSPNDLGDKDIGPNDLMNFPEIKSAVTTLDVLIVKGTIDTKKAKEVTIEIFANANPDPGKDPSGFGEGATYLGSIKPTADGKFKAILPYVPLGTWITTTATDANGSTSEFSRAVEVQ